MTSRITASLTAALVATASPALALTPVGAEYRINQETRCDQTTPHVAVLPAGGFVAVWTDGSEEGQIVMARRFAADGSPLGNELQVSPESVLSPLETALATNTAGRSLVVWAAGSAGGLRGRGLGPSVEPSSDAVTLLPPEVQVDGFDVAALPDGSFLAAWVAGGRTLARRLAADGTPAGDPLVVDDPGGAPTFFSVSAPRLAVEPDGGFLVVWLATPPFDPFSPGPSRLWARRYAASGQPLGPRFALVETTPSSAITSAPALATRPAGGFLVAWSEIGASPHPNPDDAIRVLLLDAAAAPVGPPLRVDESDLAPEQPTVATSSDGRFLVAWSADSGFGATDSEFFDIHARAFAADGTPRGPQVRVNTFLVNEQREPALASLESGRFVALWTSRATTIVVDPPPPICVLPGQDGSAGGVYGRLLVDGGCETGGDGACLSGGRFQATVVWQDPRSGTSGLGHPVPVTDDTGGFWFFDPANVELVVKVLDGRAINGHFWVFYGSLTDVRFILSVTDTVTDRTHTYENPAFHLASFADTAAFEDPAAPPGTVTTSPAARTALGLVAAPAPLELASRDGSAGPCAPPPVQQPAPSRPGLCLGGGRFEVEVAWTDPFNGGSGAGHGVLLSDRTGYLWFFSPNNVELVVKVLDGRALNGHFWVLYGALTNVGYTLTVRDTVSGMEARFENPPLTFGSRADIEALPGP